MNWIKKHKKTCLFMLLIVLVAVTIGIIGSRKKEEDKKETRETVTVERRTLMQSISATGSFCSPQETKVTSETTGVKVMAVNVEVGDTVSPGDTICVLDTEDLKEQLSSAQESLIDTQTQVERTKNSATRNLEQAKTDRDDSIKKLDDDISEAKTQWENAEKTYDSSVSSYNAALKELEGITNHASSAYITANNQATALKRQMETDRATADALKKQYESLVADRDKTVQNIEQTYQNQEEAYQETIDGTKNATGTQEDVIEELNKQISGAIVKATTGGLVTAVNVAVGDTYAGSVIAMVENVDSFDVTAEIGEYDINQVEVGQEVVIKTNATGDEELSGVVKKVSPIASGQGGTDIGGGLGFDVQGLLEQSGMSGMSTGSNDVTFTVTIGVNTPCDKLRIGMTAKINIILQKNEDVLSVPYNVVQSDKKGNYYVQKVTGKNKDGIYQTKKIKVEKGIESDYYTELINSGLKEGEKLLLPESKQEQNLEDMITDSSSMGGV